MSKRTSDYFVDLAAFLIAVIPITIWIGMKAFWSGLKAFGQMWMDWFSWFKDDLLG